MKKIILAWCLTWLGATAFAEDNDVVHFRMHLDRNHVYVNEDGTYTSEYEASYTLLTAAAVQSASQVPFGYNPDFNSVEIKSAWVEHADGTRTAVDLATAVHDRSQTSGVIAPMLTQDRMKLLVFPDVKMGDTLHYVRRVEQRRSMYPHQFNMNAEQRLDQISEDSELIIDAPASMSLHIENVGYKEERTTLKDGKVRYCWQISNTVRKPYEDSGLPIVLTSPHVIVTTFSGYDQLAASYREGAADKSAVTPAIQALADQIAGDSTAPRDVAIKLSDWVSRNIRYVALYFGAGGVVPVAADDVLKNRYGDCKGHVVLLEALLKARGIASTGALVNLNGALYRLPKTTFVGFDHIISYVPSLDLWLDSTANSLPYGTLPESEAGKPALLVATGEVKYIPVDGSQKTSSSFDAQLKLQDNGDLDMNARFTLHGPESTDARQFFHNMQPQGRRDFVRDVLASGGLAGNGELSDTGEPDALDRDFSYAYRATLFSYAAVPGPFGFALPMLDSFHGPGAIVHTAEYYVANTAPRESEYVCSNVDREEHYHLALPARVKLLSVPSDLDIADGDFHYRARYQVNGNVLNIDRSLTTSRTSSICPADGYVRYRPFFTKVMNNLRSQVIYLPFDTSVKTIATAKVKRSGG